MSDFRNDQGNGSVLADTGTITALGGTTATFTSFVGSVTGNISGGTTFGLVPQLIIPTGATQGTATAITGSLAIITACTASARGAKLPTAATGKMVYIMSLATQGAKIWPFSGDRIGVAATNTAVVQAGLKGELYVAKDAVSWAVLKGA